MTLPSVAGSHHTVWITPPGGAPRPLRYAVEGGRLVCFGDDGLDDVPDATRVSASIHEIAGGPELASFGATVRTLAPDQVDRSALAELLAHVSLGRTLDEVEARMDEHRTRRRVVEIVP